MNFNKIINTAVPLLDKEGWMNSFSEFRRSGRKYKHIFKIIKLKNNIQNIVCIFIITLFSVINAHSQSTEEANDPNPEIIVKARAKGDKILLRWGVNEKFAWKYGNEHGYIVERVTVLRDSQPLLQPERKILTGGAIKPKPLAEWEALANKSDMAAVAAQAIYGEDFEVNDEESDSKLMQVVYESEELDRRFGFSMYAIDQDFEAAQYAGLGYIDEDVKSNEKYLYNISAAVPGDIMKINPSGIFISPSEEEKLPKPTDFAGYYYKKSFVLVWEYDLMLPYYTSYDIEKSEDGKHFTKLNQTPITKLADTEYSGISYTDSVQQFNKPYWYRVVGRSPFNEESEPSDAIELIGHEEMQAIPMFEDNVIISDTEVELSWDIPEQEAWKVQKFDLLRAETAIGPYSVVIADIEAKTRMIRYKELKPINYFKIQALGVAGDKPVSPSNMVQPVDSIPPLKPLGLAGVIDTSGVVRLTWKHNTEPDLKGYQILRADRPGQEFTMLNKYSVTTPDYSDTINLRSFNPKVYYKIMALDHRYNESEYSEILELNRPDKIPPTSPVFDSYKLQPEGVYLKWIKSSSEDVEKEIIYRKTLAGQSADIWEKVYETTDTIASYVDKNTVPGSKYLYTLVSVDNSGLESNPSPPLAIEVMNTLLKEGIKGVYASIDRENKFVTLTWRITEPDIQEILLYKKEKEQPYVLYKTLNADQKQFTDQALYPSTTYKYALKAIFNDGTVSEWQEIEVVY